MLSSIGFLVFGLFLSCGAFMVAKDMIFSDDHESKIGDLPAMGFGILLGGFFAVLGGGGIYFELRDKKKEDPVAILTGVPEQKKETQETIKMLRLLITEGVETTAKSSSKLVTPTGEIGYQIGQPENKTRIDTYSYWVDDQYYELRKKPMLTRWALACLLPKDGTISLVYLPSNPQVALIGNKRLLADLVKRFESSPEANAS